MIYTAHPPANLTPVEVGLELLLGSQQQAHDLIALGLSIFMMAMLGAIGVGFVKLVATGIALIRADLGDTFVRARPRDLDRPLGYLNPKPYKGDDDGI